LDGEEVTVSNKFTITIEVEGGTNTAVLRDSSGNEKTVHGLALFAQAPYGTDLYTFCWGESREAARALVEGLAQATNRGDSFYQAFYKEMLRALCARTGTNPNAKEITAEELEKQWSTKKEDGPTWN
jgi:hypothetical protein